MPVHLTRPVASAMIPIDALAASTTLRRAAEFMRENGTHVAPVLGEDHMVRFLLAEDLAQALADGRDQNALALDYATDDRVPLIFTHETGAAAMRRFVENDVDTLAVIDPAGSVIGLLRSADLYEKPPFEARPPMVGGMATPFGVYLTNGSLKAGVPWYALTATGAVLATLLITGVFVGNGLANFSFHQNWPELVTTSFERWLPFIFFCLLMRILPLSGIHAAEHMTVHAIERGEALTPEVVRRMPRVHPRCGTNLAVAGSLFLGVFSIPWIADQELRLLAAILAAVLLRIPLGSLMQYWVTTKPPSDKQLLMGIRSGQELLQRYQFAPRNASSPLQRIAASGMLQVLLGSTAVILLAHFLGMD